jgi:hypothetical protein
MTTRTIYALIVVLGFSGALAVKAFYPAAALPSRGNAAVPRNPAWAEVPWPFLMDQWGKGKAFRCKAADCGADVDLYVRAKIGFCNCTTGVADDEELERVADVSLFDDQYKALADGRPITVGTMKGRSRPYAVTHGAPGRVLAIAFNERCDVIVATAVIASAQPSAFEPAVLAFLNGDTMMRWAEVTLGL